jgi:hypothetical protein
LRKHRPSLVLWAALAWLGCGEAPSQWGPECGAFLREAEAACETSLQTSRPLVCEGAREGAQRLTTRGFGDYESECRAARESLARDLRTTSTITPED